MYRDRERERERERERYIFHPYIHILSLRKRPTRHTRPSSNNMTQHQRHT